jgi:hypothetical protein
VNRCAAPQRGLALPGTLLLLVLLALAMAAAQRGAALQWRAAAWEHARLQAREDAWGALRAAQAWVDAQGMHLPVQDCTGAGARAAGAPRVCAQAAVTPGDAAWTVAPAAARLCAQACAFHVQALAQPEPQGGAWHGPPGADGAPPPPGLPGALRLSAWSGGPAGALLQLDLQARAASGPGPSFDVRAWRVLR